MDPEEWAQECGGAQRLEAPGAWEKGYEPRWDVGAGAGARSDAASLLPPQEVMKHLTLAELTDLIWTAVEGLGSTSPFRVQAAASMLLTAVQEHGAQLETVRAGETRGAEGGPAVTPQGQGVALSLSLMARHGPHPGRLRGGREGGNGPGRCAGR